MKQYEVIHSFADLHDNKYFYKTGDMFPRQGVKVSEDRLNELASAKNKMKKALIKVIPTEPKKKTTSKRKNKNADRTVQGTK